MRVNVVGKEVVNYVKNGQPVQGIRLHVTYPNPKEGSEGLACQSEYFSNRYAAYSCAAQINLGDEVDMFYNQYGRIDTLQIVPPSPAPADKK